MRQTVVKVLNATLIIRNIRAFNPKNTEQNSTKYTKTGSN